MEKKLNYRLALDLGTNSLGWAMYELCEEEDEKTKEDKKKQPCRIVDTGVRIFSDGRKADAPGTTLNSQRRLSRLARRRRDHFLQRRNELLRELIRQGLLPRDEQERNELFQLRAKDPHLKNKDPYHIRSRALHEQVTPHEMGRALFHINQRRGFKSNRKSNDNEAGRVKSSIAMFEIQMLSAKAKTIGEYLANRHKNRETVRAREIIGDSEKRYELYPQRDMLEEEVVRLWNSQKRFDREVYSDDNLKKFSTSSFIRDQ